MNKTFLVSRQIPLLAKPSDVEPKLGYVVLAGKFKQCAKSILLVPLVHHVKAEYHVKVSHALELSNTLNALSRFVYGSHTPLN